MSDDNMRCRTYNITMKMMFTRNYYGFFIRNCTKSNDVAQLNQMSPLYSYVNVTVMFRGFRQGLMCHHTRTAATQK